MSILLDKSVKPNDTTLAATLGTTYKYWRAIKSTLEKKYGPLTEEWKYYGGRSGWTLKMLHKKRNLFFVGPYDGYFRVAFVFGDKAVEAIQRSDLPPTMVLELKNAKRYAEGRGLRIDVKKPELVAPIVDLVAYKLQY